jgi:hypothetical protein
MKNKKIQEIIENKMNADKQMNKYIFNIPIIIVLNMDMQDYTHS